MARPYERLLLMYYNAVTPLYSTLHLTPDRFDGRDRSGSAPEHPTDTTLGPVSRTENAMERHDRASEIVSKMTKPTETTVRRMRNQRQHSTGPELALRRVLHARGLRYRVNRPAVTALRSRPDIIFSGPRVAVYIDGCFWHSCPKHGTLARTNHSWWAAKLAANTRRDREADRQLRASGWTVLRFWEHEDPLTCADIVEATVRTPRLGPER